MQNWTLGRVWDIPIKVNVSLVIFLPVLAWLIGSGQQIETYAGVVGGFTGTPLDVASLRAGVTPWLVGSLAAVGLFVSVAIHELGHAWMGRRYGLHVKSITLWILGGLASFTEIPREWNRELWIALAGPVTSMLVAAVCYVVVLALPSSLTVPIFVFGWLAITNFVLAVFNLLPAFPMDGGRVLRALLARSWSYANATRTAARIGSLFALGFVLLGVLAFSPLLILLALFLYVASTSESRMVMLEDLLEGITVGDIVADDRPTVEAGESVRSLLDRMMRERRTEYAVVDGGDLVGVVSLQDIRKVTEVERGTTTVGSLAETPTVTLDASTRAFDALAALTEAKTDRVIVEDGGRPVGVVTGEDFGATLSFLRSTDGPGRR
jgi:Zn-dependent protease/CBS domain-containing protein